MPGDVQEIIDAIRARKRRKLLRNLLLGSLAVGGGAMLGRQLLKGRSGVSPAPAPAPAPDAPAPEAPHIPRPIVAPSVPAKDSSSIGKKVLAGLAIPAGLGVTYLGGRMALPALRKPLSGIFGKEIAQQARKHGITHVLDPREAKTMRSWLKGMGLKSDQKAIDRIARVLDKASFGERKAKPGSVHLYAFNPRRAGVKGGVGATSTEGIAKMWDNKTFQAKMLRDAGIGHLMPQELDKKTLDRAVKELHALHRSGAKVTDKEINATLKKLTGKDWFFKAKGNTAGRLPGDLWFNIDPGDPMSLTQFRNTLTRGTTYQESIPTREYGELRKGFWNSRLGRWLESQSPVAREYGLDRSLPRQTEYRVHVMNGKVIPFATSEKWDTSRHFSRFETREKRDIERQVQEMMDKILAYQDKKKGILDEALNARKQVFGLDVGVRPDGRMVVYEFNPSMPPHLHSGSGQLLHPDVNQAVRAAIKGRMPIQQMVQLGAGGATAGTGAYMTGKGVRDLMRQDDSGH